MSLPLKGIKILDFTSLISGPLATQLLCDQGAEVIKVETPPIGDVMRYFSSFRTPGIPANFALLNRGKRSILLDLKATSSVDTIRRIIVEWGVDVVIHNNRPGSMEKRGIGYEQVKQWKNDVIYVEISGFGSSGPSSAQPVYDSVIQALSGIASSQLTSVDLKALAAKGPPVDTRLLTKTADVQMVRQLIADKVTAYTAAQAITTALFARDRKRLNALTQPSSSSSSSSSESLSQYLSIAMLDAAVAFVWPDTGSDVAMLDKPSSTSAGVDNSKVLSVPVTRRLTIPQLDTMFTLKDGKVCIMLATDKQWISLFTVLNRPDLASDARFSSIPARMANRILLSETVTPLLLSVTVSEFLSRCVQYGVPAAPVVALADVQHLDQVKHNRLFFETVHPTAGPILDVKPPVQFANSKSPTDILKERENWAPQRPAPTLGEHTKEILAKYGSTPAKSKL